MEKINFPWNVISKIRNLKNITITQIDNIL